MTPMAFLPKLIQSKLIHYTKRRVTGIRAKLYYTGNVQFYASVNGDMNGPGTWEEVTITGSGQWASHTFTSAGGYLYFQVLMDPGTVVYEPQDDEGRPENPAISIEITTSSEVA